MLVIVNDEDSSVTRSVLRARIEVGCPSGLDRHDLEDRIAEAVTTAAAEVGATVPVLQLALAAHPDWYWFGPPDWREQGQRPNVRRTGEAPPAVSCEGRD